MPLGYGTTTIPSKLTSAMVGPHIEIRTQHKSIISEILQVLSLGVAFIPGIGPWATAAIETGLGTGNLLNQIYGEHQTPTVTSVIGDYAGAVIPLALSGVGKVVGAGVRNFVEGGRLIKGAEIASQNSFSTAKNLLNTGQSEFAADIAQTGLEIQNAGRSVTRNFLTNSNKQFENALLRQGVGAGNEALGIGTASEVVGSVGDITKGFALAAKGATAEGEAVNEALLDQFNKVGITERELNILSGRLAGVTNEADRETITLNFFKEIGKVDAVKELGQIISDSSTEPLGFFTSRASKTKQWVKNYVRSIRNPNSKQFNDNFVQKVQLMFDGNDAGRAGIEFAYGKLKKYFNKMFDKINKLIKEKFPKLFKGAKKIAHLAKKVDDAFVESGGILINSTVIRGYKVVEEKLGGNLVQIVFYPEATKSKKNPGGKEPVYIFATRTELKFLRAEGMNYYLKKWATSKNGRGMGHGILGAIFGASAGILAFFKINALRNILSLASNISQSFVAGIGHTGAFTDGWKKKFVRSFNRNWKNRAGRLVGRVIGGGAFGVINKRVGAFVGRELQRISSQIVIPILTGKKPSLKTAAFASFNSNLRRVARKRNPNSLALKSLTYQRNAGIVQRIPGSFSGGLGSLSGIKL